MKLFLECKSEELKGYYFFLFELATWMSQNFNFVESLTIFKVGEIFLWCNGGGGGGAEICC